MTVLHIDDVPGLREMGEREGYLSGTLASIAGGRVGVDLAQASGRDLVCRWLGERLGWASSFGVPGWGREPGAGWWLEGPGNPFEEGSEGRYFAVREVSGLAGITDPAEALAAVVRHVARDTLGAAESP